MMLKYLLVLCCLSLLSFGQAQSYTKLPLSTTFVGEEKFHAIMNQAVRENWAAIPFPQRIVRFGKTMLGTPYKSFTLEVDDLVENPVVNFHGLDCWTYYENALAMARLVTAKKPPYTPQDLIAFIELERYRDGRCDGTYLSRMHHLEEVFVNNQSRGLAINITQQLPHATRLHKNLNDMGKHWEQYRYLKANPNLVPLIQEMEQRVSNLKVYHIPKEHVRQIEPLLQDGDICAISTHLESSFTTHVGLIFKQGERAIFTHATSDKKKGYQVIIDAPISEYLNKISKHAGIIICRPFEKAK